MWNKNVRNIYNVKVSRAALHCLLYLYVLGTAANPGSRMHHWTRLFRRRIPGLLCPWTWKKRMDFQNSSYPCSLGLDVACWNTLKYAYDYQLNSLAARILQWVPPAGVFFVNLTWQGSKEFCEHHDAGTWPGREGRIMLEIRQFWLAFSWEAHNDVQSLSHMYLRVFLL